MAGFEAQDFDPEVRHQQAAAACYMLRCCSATALDVLLT